jgi:hypothetical protein
MAMTRSVAVQAPARGVEERAQLGARHVGEAHLRAVRVGAQHDRAELLGGHQPPLRLDDVREVGARRRRLAAELPGRRDDVLLLHRLHDVRHREAERREAVRLSQMRMA